jgi:hypothetical protein
MRAARDAANRRIAALAVAAALAVLALQLLVPPVSGLADNGDYQRVMGYAGFDHSTDVYGDRYFSFLRTQYRVLPVGWWRGGYLSSEIAVALVARVTSPAAWRGELFDLRGLAAVHIALFLLALVVLLRACRELPVAAQATAAVLSVFFFTDIGYAGPFNSFYSQTASFSFLLLLVAVAAEAVRRGRLDGALLLAYFFCAAAFVGSKPQEAIQGPLLALLALRLAGVGVRGALRRPALWLALALCGFSAWYGRTTPMPLREAVVYSVVFSDLLPNSPEPAADAAELGLDPEWLKYSGTDPYRVDTPLRDPAFRVRFLGSVGYRKIVRLYLHHPSRFAARLDRVSRKIWALRPSYGNLEKSATHPTRTLTTRFSAWSRLRLELFGPHALAWLALLLAGNAALALGTYRRASARGRLLREGLLAAALMSATAFLVSILTNAPPDLSRVFYVAEALCDLLLVADLAWLAQALTGRRATAAPATV